MTNVPKGFVRIASISDFASNDRVVTELDDTVVVVVKVDDQYFCIEDTCTHDGGILSDGELSDGCLVCSRHGARFNVRNGNAETMPATEATQTFEIVVDGDDIYAKP